MTVRRFVSFAVVFGLVAAAGFLAAPPQAQALTNANVVVVGSSECDGYVRTGHLASKLELSGSEPSIMCLSASSPSFGIDIVRMGAPAASTVVLTLGLNVRPLPIFDEPAQSDLYAPETDEDGYVTLDGFRDSVQGTIEALRALGVERIIWFPIADNDHRWHDRYVANNAILREQASELDFEVVPWDELAEADMFGADGVHYTDEGYRFFADTITETVSLGPAPTATDVGPCNYITSIKPAGSLENAAAMLGTTEEEFLDANPHWNPYWRFGGIVCRPADAAPHPLADGAPISPTADALVAYSPRNGELTEFFLGVPSGGGGEEIIGPINSHPSGLVGADMIVWSSTGSLVLYSSQTGEFSIMQRGASGVWETVQEMSGTTGWSHVIPGDYDGDGDTDVLFYRDRDGLMRFYSILPSGGFDPMTPAMYGTRGWTALVAGDYDGDGFDDVYWYRASDGLMRFYEVLPEGRFSPISPAMFGTRNWSQIVEGSYTHSASALLFYRDDGIARFYRVDVDRGFSAISPVLAVAPSYRSVASGDFDGNGGDDVFWYRSDASVMTALSGGILSEISGAAPMPQEMVFTAAPQVP